MSKDQLEPTLLLIDGLNVLRRIYEAMPAADSPEKAQGAVRSTLASLRRAVHEHRPDYALVAFDYGGSTWRHELYPQYRQNRKPMPTPLRDVIPRACEDLKSALGVVSLCVPGVEADDVIATVHRNWRSQGRRGRVIVLSTDKDLAALIADGALVWDHFTPQWRDAAWVFAKFGVRPDQLQDALALAGDASDGIPGVEKVGVKTAAAWLGKYQTLENLLAHADEIQGKAGERLRQQAHVARLSRQLVSFRTDLTLGLTWHALRLS